MSDWEGPWVTADHAYEITKCGVPNGDKLFAALSEYDDYLAYIKRKPGYEPGDTLSLIAPFLVAFNVSDTLLLEVAKKNANFIKGSLEAIQFLRKEYDLNIISTSYCQYVYYTTKLAGIRPEKVSCTNFPIDDLSKTVNEVDKEFVKKEAKSILNLSTLGISSSTKESEINSKAKQTLESLDRFFWEDLPKTSFNYVMKQTRPLGGHRKLEALLQHLQKHNLELSQVVVIGDSITDWVMLKKTKEAGGLAISFNGNDYALNNSTLAIISKTCLVTPIIVDLFFKSGIKNVERIAKQWSMDTIIESAEKGHISSAALKPFMKALDNDSENFPLVAWLDKENIESTIKKSKEMRKSVRGVAIGSLG
jgi:energy-converting hydrogenase A subunit R